MFIDKVINEVIRFNKIKIKKNKSANKIIGITEITSYLKGLYNLEETKEKILIKTRQYAKRQTTWSRGQMINWIKLDFLKKKKFLLKFNS